MKVWRRNRQSSCGGKGRGRGGGIISVLMRASIKIKVWRRNRESSCGGKGRGRGGENYLGAHES